MIENRIGVSPFPWGDAINAFKGAGEMQLVGITHGAADLVDGIPRHFKELRSLDHAVADQKLLRGFAYGILEYFAKIAAVD